MNARPILYIDPPTIPAGMSVQTYRQQRELNRSRKVRGIRRIASKAMTA